VGRFSTGLAVLITVLLWGFAIPANAMGPPQRHRVEVVLGGPDESTQAMQAILDELLGRLAVDVEYAHVEGIELHAVVTPREQAKSATARVWLDLTGSRRATVYLADEGWERILVRNLELTDGLDEVGREQLGHIVETSVEALLEGGQIGVTRVQAIEQLGVEPKPQSESEPAPPEPQEPPPAGGWVELGYQTQFWGGPVPAYHGPMALAGLIGSGNRVRPGAFISAQYLTPATLETDLLALRLQGGAFRLMAALAPKVSDNLALHVALGGGMDVIAVSPRSIDEGMATPSRRYVVVFPEGQAEFGLWIALPRGFELRFAGVLGVDLIDGFYFVEGAEQPFFDPWVVRPGLRVSLAWGSPGARF
jgi:hypothetical protein